MPLSRDNRHCVVHAIKLLDELAIIVDDANAVRRHARIFEAQRHVLGTVATANRRALACADRLPARIVNPRDIRTVTFLIIEYAHEAHVLIGLVEQQVDNLIAACRILHEHEAHLGTVDVENL